VRALVPDVVVVDDGSAEAGRSAVEQLGVEKLAHVLHRAANGGKGAAVKSGFTEASRLGFTHALQVDADGQHDLADVPRFLEAARKDPDALVLGYPLFDASAPMGRKLGRKITIFWSTLETGGRSIVDPMCGFRVYPIAQALLGSQGTGNRMEFDIEIAVRMVWNRTRTINLPTKVRYLTAAEGGVSHFHMLGDNARISWMHTRMVVLAILRVFTWPVRRLRA